MPKHIPISKESVYAMIKLAVRMAYRYRKVGLVIAAKKYQEKAKLYARLFLHEK